MSRINSVQTFFTSLFISYYDYLLVLIDVFILLSVMITDNKFLKSIAEQLFCCPCQFPSNGDISAWNLECSTVWLQISVVSFNCNHMYIHCVKIYKNMLSHCPATACEHTHWTVHHQTVDLNHTLKILIEVVQHCWHKTLFRCQ